MYIKKTTKHSSSHFKKLQITATFFETHCLLTQKMTYTGKDMMLVPYPFYPIDITKH